MSNTLYHYCSVDTFKKIIANRTLKLSDVMKSNDSNEIVLLWNKFYEQIKSQSTNQNAVATTKFMMDRQLERTVYLTLCLSKKDDSLHMWNCYGDGGLAIGFDVEKLRRWTKRICMHNFVDPNILNKAFVAKLDNIHYLNSDQIDAYVKKICKNVTFASDGFEDVFKNAPFCKSNFFKDEAEARIVITIFMLDDYYRALDYVDDKGNFISKIKFESLSNGKFQNILACYIPFDADMINSIVIGPNCSLKENDINQIFFINDINKDTIDIVKSKGSYR